MCVLFLWHVNASLAVLWYELLIWEGNNIFQKKNISSQAPSVELLVGLVRGNKEDWEARGKAEHFPVSPVGERERIF